MMMIWNPLLRNSFHPPKLFRVQSHHPVLVLLWMIIGLVLRFHHLSLKPLWADECSTLVFSLGHSFQAVPLGQLISTQQLLAPLQWDGIPTPFHAAQTLLTESNHPPLFFVLTHGWVDVWVKVWQAVFHGMVPGIKSAPHAIDHQGLEAIPLGLARSLSALFGGVAIPMTYLTAKTVWRSPASTHAAHFAALLMALSPFGIYLAQEARHYTLTILWILGSLLCLVKVLQHWRDRQPIPLGVMISWVGLNGLGIATHYFFGLTVLAEAIVLMIGLFILHQDHDPQEQTRQLRQNYRRLGAIILGTIASGAVWMPFLLAIQQGDELTRWIQTPQGSGWSGLSPVLNTLGSMVTMLYVLPIQGVNAGVAIASGLAITLATVVTLIILNRAIANAGRFRDKTVLSDDALALFVFGGVILSAIAIMLGVTYGFGMDISQAFRYHFVYFPAVILVIGWGLAQHWHDSDGQPSWGRSRLWIGAVLMLALLGALTVSNNFAYQKVHRPDRVVDLMAERSHHPLIVAISHQSHGQTGRLMALAWAMERQSVPSSAPANRLLLTPQFFLDSQPCDRPGEQNCNTPSPTLRQTLNRQDDTFDLWLINYVGQTNLTKQNCTYRKTKRVDGYKAQHYTCGRVNLISP